MSDRGVITICRGREPYFDMAHTFALSMRRTNPAVPLAVVTDQPGHPALRVFDTVLPRRAGWGEGFMEKMYLPRYSPYARTLYLDVDMLAVRAFEWFWEAVRGQALTTLARPVLREGYWYGDVASHCRAFDLPELRTLNGGLLYFEAGPDCDRLMDEIRALEPGYDAAGLARNHGLVADEPLIAIVLQRHGVRLFDDAGRLMRSPMDCAWLHADVLRGRCAFGQEGRVYEPDLVHFSAGYTDYFHYRRERARLRAAARLPWVSAGIVSAAMAAVWNPAYAVEVAARRLARRVLRGERGPWRDVLPVSRYR